MDLVLTLVALTLSVVVLEMLMRVFEDPSTSDPRDSFPSSVVAICFWMALVSPLFVSYS